MITFVNPEYTVLFFLVPAYILLALIAYLFYKRRFHEFFGVAQMKKMLPDWSFPRIIIKKALVLVGLLFLLIAIANPRWGEVKERKSRLNTDLMVLVDVSSSMLVEDIQPNRLEKVKLKIGEIIKMQRGTRIGITVFAGSSFVYTPLTSDYNSLQSFLKNITTSMVSKQGTDLALGLKTSLSTFIDDDAQKILVVFTDGENHNKSYQDVVAEYVEKDITVFMIGVGSPNGEKIPLRNELGVISDYLRDQKGDFVISKLDYSTLADITEKTGGVYFPLTAEQDDILTINNFINQTQNRFEEGGTELTLKSRYQIFATLALIFLLAETVIGSAKSKSKNKTPKPEEENGVKTVKTIKTEEVDH